MEGRWTIRKWDGGSEVLGDRTVGYTPSGDVPVVPCDDAAIERAMSRLRVVGYPWLENMSETLLRALAEAALAAAGDAASEGVGRGELVDAEAAIVAARNEQATRRAM